MNEKIIDFQKYKKETEQKNMKKVTTAIKPQNEIKIGDNEILILEKSTMAYFKNKASAEKMNYDDLYDAFCDVKIINKQIGDVLLKKCKEEYITGKEKTFKELLQLADIEVVINTLASMFDYEDFELEEFRTIYEMLLERQVTFDEEKQERMYLILSEDGDVIAFKNDKIIYDIETKSWSEWLNALCSEKILEEMSINNWVARCLWTMTFLSFDEEQLVKRNEEQDYLKEKIKESAEKDRQTFKELIWMVDWLDVKEVIEDYYIDYEMYDEEIEEILYDFQEFFKKIMAMPERKKTANRRLYANMKGESYIFDLDTDEVLEVCEEYWEVILGTKCSEKSFKEVTECEMVAHVMAEMLFYTNDEETHKKNIEMKSDDLDE